MAGRAVTVSRRRWRALQKSGRGVVWVWSRPEEPACLQGSLEAPLDGRDAGDFFGVSRGHRACCGTFRERARGRHLLETTFGRTATAPYGWVENDPCKNNSAKKPTTPAVPRRSPIQVLSRPDTA